MTFKINRIIFELILNLVSQFIYLTKYFLELLNQVLMKQLNYLFVFILLTVSTTLTTAQITEKTLIKSFNLGHNDYVEVDLNGHIEIQEWSNSIMRINVTIGVENCSEATLKSLMQAGRYNMKAHETENGLTINAPGLNRTVTLRGAELKEDISYVIYKPKNVHVRLLNEATGSNEDVKKLTDL